MHLLSYLHLHHGLNIEFLASIAAVLPRKFHFRFELLLKFSERLSIEAFVIFTISVILVGESSSLLLPKRGVLSEHLLLYHLLLLLVLHVLDELPLLCWIHVVHVGFHRFQQFWVKILHLLFKLVSGYFLFRNLIFIKCFLE